MQGQLYTHSYSEYKAETIAYFNASIINYNLLLLGKLWPTQTK